MSDEKTMSKAILLAIDESEDPMPEFPQVSGFRVFAGSCQSCGCSGRKLLPSDNRLSLFCDKCGNEYKTILSIDQWPEVSYVYWCNTSKFASDDVILAENDMKMLEAEIKKMGSDFEIPYWAVMIVAGRCFQSEVCINTLCPYLRKST